MKIQGDYKGVLFQILEAQLYKDKLVELIGVEFQRKIRILKSKQEKEIYNIENAQLDEISQFNQNWDERIRQFKKEGKVLETELKEKQKFETERLREDFYANQSPPKGNPELLNLIEMRKKMVKMRKYADADMASQRIQEIKVILNQEWNAKENKKLDNLMVSLEKKHFMEMKGLKIRTTNGIKEQEKIQAKKLDELLQKYQNLKRELENKHSSDLQKLTKTLQKRSFTYRLQKMR